MTLFVAPRASHKGFEIALILPARLMFVGTHFYHLWMTDRSLGKDR